MVRKILLLGNTQLYEVSEEIKESELEYIKEVVGDLHDTITDFRNKNNWGRAIAAPQIGVKKKLIYMLIDKPVVFINPVMEFGEDNAEQMEVLDDCMSFPNLLVKLWRHKKSKIYYKDLDFKDCEMELDEDLSELLQHEYDHLDGILATMRAKDNMSFVLRESI